MLGYFYNTLYSFRSVFSRESTWLVFCMVFIGFIGGSEMVGVTSFCRFWGVDVKGPVPRPTIRKVLRSVYRTVFSRHQPDRRSST